MSYIGNPIISTDFPKDTFSGNGSTTAFTMSIAPASVNAVIVVVSGITQDPSTYTISGTTLTFSAAPPTGTSNISVRHLGVAGIPNTPSAGSVVTTSIADANITQAKLASGVAGTGPAFGVYNSTAQSVSSGVNTKVSFNTEEFDTNNNFASSTFTPTVAGYYQINAGVYFSGSGIGNAQVHLYKNGADYKATINAGMSVSDWTLSVQSVVYLNGTTDYIDLYVYVTGSSLVLYSNGTGRYTYMSGSLLRAA